MTDPPLHAWVRRLTPQLVGGHEAEPPVASVCYPQTVADVTARLGADAVAWAALVSHDLALLTATELSPLTESGHDVHLLRLATEPAVLATLLGIEAGRVEVATVPPEIQFVLSEYVRRRVPLEATVESVVHGHARLSELLMAACRRLVAPGELAAQLELVSRTTFGYLTALSSGVADVYAREQHEWEQSGDRARDELVRTVLAGEPGDVAAVSRRLTYRIENRVHIGLVLWRRESSPAGAPALADLVHAVLDGLGATDRLVLPVGHVESWAWCSRTGTAPDLTTAPAVVDLLASARARAAVGNAAAGLAGLRSTHQQALRAARVSRLPGARSTELIAFHDVSLASLLSADLPAAREFVLEELGALAGADRASRELRETVLTYLECNRSPQAAASRLFVSRNTVTYRVKRVESLLGHELTHRETELRAALLLARFVGVGGRLTAG